MTNTRPRASASTLLARTEPLLVAVHESTVGQVSPLSRLRVTTQRLAPPVLPPTEPTTNRLPPGPEPAPAGRVGSVINRKDQSVSSGARVTFQFQATGTAPSDPWRLKEADLPDLSGIRC